MKNLKCVFVCYVGLSVYAVDGQYFFYLKIELSKSTYKMLYLVHLKGMFLRIKYSKTVNFSLVKLSYVNLIIQFSSVQSLSRVYLRPDESQHARPHHPSPTPRIYPNSCPSSW